MQLISKFQTDRTWNTKVIQLNVFHTYVRTAQLRIVYVDVAVCLLGLPAPVWLVFPAAVQGQNPEEADDAEQAA